MEENKKITIHIENKELQDLKAKIEEHVINANKYFNTDTRLPIVTNCIYQEITEAVNDFEKSLNAIKELIKDEQYKVIFQDLLLLQIDNFLDVSNTLKTLHKSDYIISLIEICKKLSRREKEIFYYFYVEKKDFIDIMQRLNITQQTIRTHLCNINRKFGIESSSKNALTNKLPEKPEGINNVIIKQIIDYTGIFN